MLDRDRMIPVRGVPLPIAPYTHPAISAVWQVVVFAEVLAGLKVCLQNSDREVDGVAIHRLRELLIEVQTSEL